MHIKTATVIPTNIKITRCEPSEGKGKSVYTLLRHEERKLEKAEANKQLADRFTKALKAGHSVPEALKIAQGT